MGILGKIFKSDDENQAVANGVTTTSVKVDKTGGGAVSDVKVVTNEKAPERNPGKKKQDAEAYKVISSPLITEKATDLMVLNKYVFAVPVSSNKAEVIKKIFNIYGVKPVKVNLLVKKGKKVRHGKTKGRTGTIKKAIITLDPKDKIEVYEGV